MSNFRQNLNGVIFFIALLFSAHANAGILQDGWHSALSVVDSTAEIVSR